MYGYGFQQFFAFSGFMGMVLVKFHLLVSFLQYPDLWVWFSETFPHLWYTFEKFLRIYEWYFYDLNVTTSYLGNSIDPPGNVALSQISLDI